MLPPQPRHIGIVRFQSPERLPLGGQAGAAQQMPRGVLVAAGTVVGEREIDHRPQQQYGRQLVLARQRLRCRGQDFIPIAVQLAPTLQHQSRRAVQVRPGDKEAKRARKILVILDKIKRLRRAIVWWPKNDRSWAFLRSVSDDVVQRLF